MAGPGALCVGQGVQCAHVRDERERGVALAGGGARTVEPLLRDDLKKHGRR
jgi:hypothetical protein